MNNNGCNCSCGCPNNNKKDLKSKCPECLKKSISVDIKTVKAIVKNKKVLSNDFFICENPDCDVVYFSENQIFKTSDLKFEVDFKNSSKIKYACYCNKLTYDEAIEAAKKIKLPIGQAL